MLALWVLPLLLPGQGRATDHDAARAVFLGRHEGMLYFSRPVAGEWQTECFYLDAGLAGQAEQLRRGDLASFRVLEFFPRAMKALRAPCPETAQDCYVIADVSIVVPGYAHGPIPWAPTAPYLPAPPGLHTPAHWQELMLRLEASP